MAIVHIHRVGNKELYQKIYYQEVFMKKLTKRLLSLGIVSTLALSMTACGSSDSTKPSASPADSATPKPSASSEAGDKTDKGDKENQAEAQKTEAEIEKPDKITLMVDGTFCNIARGQDYVREHFKELTGIQLDIIQPDHNSYYDQLSIAFTSGMEADLVVLSASYYSAYAAQGALWDMSDAWESSETKASGRINEDYVNALYIDDGLYGFAAGRGNGCITYLRQDWLDNLGLQVPTTYDEYVEVLRGFTYDDPDGNGINDTYGLTAPGLIGLDAPYTNYLPEFWQDAYPDFYQKEDGTWVDGFSEEANVKALQRLKDAYSQGLIDMEVATNKTSTCRDKFYAGKAGAFTYWAGKWNKTLLDNVQALNPEAGLVAIEPIDELGKYIERQAPVLAITNTCKNPEGVFKYFIETMVDGAEGQRLFTYGVEGIHWEQKDGVYKQLPDRENPVSTFTTTFNDQMLLISDWAGENPFASLVDPVIRDSNQKFVDNAVVAPVVVSNDVKAAYAATLLDIRTVIITDVVTGTMSVEEGMAKYNEQASQMVEEILASLNN